MALKFYKNSLDTGMSLQPNEDYRELQQAFINQAWDNTTARRTVEEQNSFGPLLFHEIEAWANAVVGTTTTFMKNGADYCQLVFKDIDRKVVRGLYYRFDENYWISDFTSPYQGLNSDLTVRRCNNFLRIIDPENGDLFSIPCVVDYDMSSPQIQVSSYIITPNNHATVFVQANENTLRLFKLNTRYILNGRPFKLYAYQNALNENMFTETSTVLYLDLYLDEAHAKDDFVNQIAYNGEYDYTVVVNNGVIENKNGATGKIDYYVCCNDEIINKSVLFVSSDLKVVTVDEKGFYTIKGVSGQEATITLYLKDNDNVFTTVKVIVTNDEYMGDPVLILTPKIDKVRQYEKLNIEAIIEQSGTKYVPDIFKVVRYDSEYMNVSVQENHLVIEGTGISQDYQNIEIYASNRGHKIEINYTYSIKCVNMLG